MDAPAPAAPLSAAELRERLIRNIGEATLERQQREPLYDTRCGSVSNRAVAKKLGAGYDEVAPGKRGCPYHYHLAQEEMFVILEGHGTLRVAGEMLAVKQGDVVVIPPGPEYPHQFINTSDQPLKYLSISTLERPEVAVYPDSNKVAAWHFGLKAMQRVGTELDYWDGEP
jgi:uncharacterized cupin superfamily protein